GDAVGQHARRDDRRKRDKPLREERVIGQVGRRNRLEVKLLALRLEPRRLERGERRGQRLLGEEPLDIEPFVFGQCGGDRVVAAGDLGPLLEDQLLERSNALFYQRDLRAVRRVFRALGELRLGVGELRVHLGEKLDRPRRGALWIEHLL